MTRRGNHNRQRKEGTMTFIDNAKKLIAYTASITNKKFSKSVRFSLSNRILDKAFEIQHLLLLANEINPKNSSEVKARLDNQIEALVCCKELGYFIELSFANGHIDSGNEVYWSSLLTDVQRTAGGWHKSDKLRYSNLL